MTIPRAALLVLAACGGDKTTPTDESPADADTDADTDSDVDADTDADADADADADTDADTDAAPDVDGALTFSDATSGNPLPAVQCDLGGTLMPADASGTVAFQLPGQDDPVVHCGDGGAHLDVLQVLSLGSDAFHYTAAMATPGTLNLLGGALGLGAYDDTKGMLGMTVLDGSGAPLVGAQVSIDAANSGSVVGDGSFVGYAPGDTVPADGNGYVIFSNVDPGDVTVTVTTPGGETCATGPYLDHLVNPVGVEAGRFTLALLACQ